MRPPSSTSERGLFDGVLARGGVAAEVSDRAWLQAMLDVEAALARAQARAGLIAAEHADAIAQACSAERFDPGAIGVEATRTGSPAVPLVKALTGAVEGEAAGQVHRGATSQDVVDSAAMLVAHRALGPLLDDLESAAGAAAALASEHRDTVMAGRTLLQQALPVTFGLKAAEWLAGLDEALARLDEIRRTRLAAQLGGAAGTLASLGDAGPEVLAAFAEELGLAEPPLAWHTIRVRPGELAGALGVACGVVAKVGRDVTLLAQTEVAEVREGVPGRGGSSTLPHKRNPVAAVSAVACAMRAPGLVAELLGAMAHEHERAAGAWHAEWRPFGALLETTGSACAWLRDCLEHLEVDADRMRANLELTHGALLAERVTTALAPALGRQVAHERVQAAAQDALGSDRPLRDVLLEDERVLEHLAAEEVDTLLDPAQYLGATGELIERALRAHADRVGQNA
ncbi:MAG TPA: 3-carboxy-cis,cis-muconate cycloisomerase [Solirubrobacteraceae bacterium]|nr:3-carboxy-cis,cis-muconate cycloisomerase [Solirubrobacteraceae bacterium]